MKKKKTFKKKGKGRNPSIQLTSQYSEETPAVIEESADESEELTEETSVNTVEPQETEETAAVSVEPEAEIQETAAEETAEQEAEETQAAEEPVNDETETAEADVVPEKPAEDEIPAAEETAVEMTPEEPEVKEEPNMASTEKYTEPATRSGHGYWIHHKVKAEGSMSGYFYLSTCDCSVCGYTANMEKKICHSCGAIMDLKAPEE